LKNLSNWKDIAELIGITAIVASLLFVGLQMKQSQDIAVADQYQDRADAALDWYLARMQSESALKVVAQGLTGDTNFESSPGGVSLTVRSEDPIILAQKYLEFRANITMFDNYHFQYQHGFLQEEAWQAFRARIKIWLSNKLNAEIYRQQKNQYRKSFQVVCDDLLNQNAKKSR
jgi:hypothetical protein